MATLSFHHDAAARFDELGQEIVRSARLLPDVQEPSKSPHELYPVAHLTQDDIIGEIQFTQSIVDGTESEIGRTWKCDNKTFGWMDADFQKLVTLAHKVTVTDPFANLVSSVFVLDKIFEWARGSVEHGISEPLHSVLERHCSGAIRPYQIWTPLFQTFSVSTFQLGVVTFRTITKEMMESRFQAILARLKDDHGVKIALDRQRSRLQSHLAGVVSLTAEYGKAVSVARNRVDEAAALLRFLSPANWTWKIRSYAVPLGLENIELRTELIVKEDEIQSISNSAVKQGPTAWNIDEVLKQLTPNPVPLLHSLALDHRSDFKRDLYNALLIYSRNNLANSVSDKLLFILVALESMLLRDSNEPIQKNLGERMAFLIGDTVERRKAIAKNVDEVYGIRSRHIHHGGEIRGNNTLEMFLYNAWDVFWMMLRIADRFQTRAALIGALEDRKFS